MKAPAGVEFYEDIDLFVYRPLDVISPAVLDEAVAYLGHLETTRSTPFNRFFDTTEMEAMELNVEYVIRLSLYRRRAYAGHPLIKSAILAVDRKAHFLARLHAAITEGSTIDVRVFHEREEAAVWLGIPLERLQGNEVKTTKRK